jgi:hypothetical protein
MYYWAGSVYACQATFFAWANDVLRYEEDSLRAVVIASMNMGSNAINAWWSIVFYGASYAPYFTRGMWAMIAVSIASKYKKYAELRPHTDMQQWEYGQHYSHGNKFVLRRKESERPLLRRLRPRDMTWKSRTSALMMRRSKHACPCRWEALHGAHQCIPTTRPPR